MVATTILSANVVIATIIILTMIVILDIDPSISLIVGSLYMGIASGMSASGTLEAISTGFGNLLTDIGLPIIFGIMIGMLLADCGGARKIALTLTKAFPQRYLPYAVALSGAIVAIPAVFEVAFIVLVPMVVSIWQETDLRYPMVIGPLAIGAVGAHTFIPPTANPLASPEILGFSLGTMMIAGLFLGVPAILLSVAIYGRVIHTLWDDEEDIQEIPFDEDGDDDHTMPSFAVSLSPIAVPIFLILLGTTANVFLDDVPVVLEFLSSNLIALLSGVLVAILVYISIKSRDDLSDQFSDAFRPIGLVMAITGAGGAFGYVIQQTGATDALINTLGISGNGLAIVLFTFMLGLVLRVAQGSGTVASITTMTIMANVNTGVASVAIAFAALAGGVSIGHVNDSGYWATTELSGLEVTGGLKTYTLGGAILSVFGLSAALILAVFM